MEHLGRDIQNAAVQIGFQTVEYRPYRPWEKGAEEYLFAQTGHQLINRLPGSTTSSIEERKKYDREKGTEKEKAVPVLTLSELRGLLYRYFSDLHHRPAKGLGETSMMKGVPDHLWEKGIVLVEPSSPIDEEIFIRLSGNSADLTIQDYGTQWDHIVYLGVGQQQVKLHPKHKKGKRYRFIRGSHDLGHIWLHDPYSGDVLKIEATPRDMAYAKGLTRYQHKRIVEYHREKYKKIEGTASLLRSRQELENELIDYHAQRKKHQTAQKLARFLGRQEKKIAYAHTIEVAPTPVGGGRITQAAPVEADPKIKRSKRAGARDPKPVVVAEAQKRGSHVEPSPSKVHDDISEIRKRNEGWDD